MPQFDFSDCSDDAAVWVRRWGSNEFMVLFIPDRGEVITLKITGSMMKELAENSQDALAGHPRVGEWGNNR